MSTIQSDHSEIARPPQHEANTLRDAWATFLDEYEWKHFSTLTFSEPKSAASARRYFNGWIRRLERRSQGALYWFFAMEKTNSGALHFHCLTHSEHPLSALVMENSWRWNGYADVVKYDKARGARFYLMKELGTPRLVDYDVSSTLRPCQYDYELSTLSHSQGPKLLI